MRSYEQTSWTPERDQELIDGWNRGETQGKLADALGVTKSTVAGRINRLRQKGVSLTRRKDVAQQNRQSGRAATKTNAQSFLAHRQAVAARQAKAALAMEATTPTARQCTTLVMDLHPRQCRYPGDMDADGNYLFCNSDKLGPGFSYCATHQKLCVTGLPARKKKR